MEYESNNWIWDGACYYPHVLGGVMITTATVGLSTSYFSGTGALYLPYLWPDLGILKRGVREKKRVRVHMDGCFDLMHYGHANALSQAKALGDELVVGVVSDEKILAKKGPPVLSMEERLALVGRWKWVDEVIPNAPYAITEQFMRTLFNEYKVDYIIHGDDSCFLMVLMHMLWPRKQAITDIVGRILSTVADKIFDKCNDDMTSHEEPHGI